MPAKPTPQIEPASLEFGDVQIGGVATHRMVLVNSTSKTVSLELKIESSKEHTSFYTSLPSKNIMRPFERKNVIVSFRPIQSGRFAQQITINNHEALEKQTVALSGNGVCIPRCSLRNVFLPQREIEKMGRHYVLSISNTEYLQVLENHANTRLEWYAAVSSGTHRKTVKPSTIPKPGEVLLPPASSKTKEWSLLHCFDVQQISPKWSTEVGFTIDEAQLVSEIDEAIVHTTNMCRRGLNTCKNQLNPNDRRIVDYVDSAPEPWEIVKITNNDFTTLGIVISPKEVSARYEQCFGVKAALLVEADLADSAKATNWYGVLTDSIPELGALWVRCYTPSMYSLKDRAPEYQVRFPGQNVSLEDLEKIRERVRFYLGVEL